MVPPSRLLRLDRCHGGAEVLIRNHAALLHLAALVEHQVGQGLALMADLEPAVGEVVHREPDRPALAQDT